MTRRVRGARLIQLALLVFCATRTAVAAAQGFPDADAGAPRAATGPSGADLTSDGGAPNASRPSGGPGAASGAAATGTPGAAPNTGGPNGPGAGPPTPPPPPPPPPPNGFFGLSTEGWLVPMFHAQLDAQGSAGTGVSRYQRSDGTGLDSGFIVQRVRPGFRGMIHDRLAYFALLEIGTANTAGPSQTFQFRGGIVDAWVAYNTGEEFAIQFGQMAVPFGLEASKFGPFFDFMEPRRSNGNSCALSRRFPVRVPSRWPVDKDVVIELRPHQVFRHTSGRARVPTRCRCRGLYLDSDRQGPFRLGQRIE